MRKTIVSTVLIIVILFGSIGIFKFLKSMKKPPKKVKKPEFIKAVTVENIKRNDHAVEISAFGTVRPYKQYNVIPEVSGKVIYLSDNFKEGYFLKEGELIAEIEPDRYENAVSIQKLTINQFETDVAYQEKLKENLKINIALAEKDLYITKSEYNRSKQLAKRNAISKTQFEKTELSYRQKLNVLQNYKNQMGLIPVAIKKLEVGLAIAKNRLKDVELSLSKTKIYSPFNGLIMKKNIEKGETVGVGKMIGIINDVSAVEIPISIEMRDIPWLVSDCFIDDLNNVNETLKRRLPKAIISVSAGNKLTYNWEGQVDRVEPSFDTSTRTLNFVVLVKKPYSDFCKGKKLPLKFGMFCKVILKGKVIKNCFKIPRLSLKDNNSLYIYKDGTLKIQKMKIIKADKSFVYVIENNGDKLNGNIEHISSYLNIAVNGMKLKKIN